GPPGSQIDRASSISVSLNLLLTFLIHQNVNALPRADAELPPYLRLAISSTSSFNIDANFSKSKAAARGMHAILKVLLITLCVILLRSVGSKLRHYSLPMLFRICSYSWSLFLSEYLS